MPTSTLDRSSRAAAPALAAALLVALLAPAAAATPPATGAISGRAIDEHTRLPVAGAVVTCVAPGAKVVVRTTALGSFLVRAAPSNSYIVDVEAPGYWKADLTEIKVVRGKTTSVTIHMYARAPGEK